MRYENEYRDRHAEQRERKADKRNRDKMMRGNRSVFTMQDAQRKRDAITAQSI